MGQLFEFLFCPSHGLLRPDNWPLLAPALVSVPIAARRCFYVIARLTHKS